MSANRIQLDGGDGDAYIKEEALSSEAMYPGTIVEKITAGTVQKHATEGGEGLCAVVVEDALQGNTVTDQYDSGALVSYHIQRSGTRFQARLKVGETVVKGQALISDGAGRVIEETNATSGVTVAKVMCYAEEAVDLSSSIAIETLIAVRAA